MKKSGLRGLLATVAIAAFACPALAAASSFTSWGYITTWEDYGTSLQLTTSAPMNNPSACSSPSVYQPLASLSDAAKTALSRDLLAALMAKKQVKLKISGTGCSAENAPMYYAVIVEP